MLGVLADLTENRRLSFEVAGLIKPFEGEAYTLSLSLVSVTNTLGNRFGSEYNDGSTLTCKLEGGNLEANVQTRPQEKSFVEGLVSGTTFDLRVTLLDFDALYQRPIFGSVPETGEPVAEAPATEPVDEPVVAPPEDVVVETAEPTEETIEEQELVEEPEAPEQAPFIEELKEEVVEESIPAEVEKKEEPKKDPRKAREKLIDQLSETVGAWRTSSAPKAPYEEEEEEEEEEETQREIYYEGEESEWEDPSKPTTPWKGNAPPVYTSEPEKGCGGPFGGCLKVAVVIGLIFFLTIMFITLEEKDLGDGPTAQLKSREDTYMPLALKALAKKELGEEDLYYLRETAEMIRKRLSLYYKGRDYPYQLNPGDKEQLAKGYAWVALAVEADGNSARAWLYDKNSRRKHPFHLLDDWFLIEAKVRVALRRPEKLLNEKDYWQVKALDLSGEKFKDTAYLLKLPSLERLYLANNRIRNLKPLSALKNLTDLNLNNTAFNSLSSLTKARSLRRLDLSNNEPTHLILLGEMKNLKQVTLTPNDTVLPQLETLKEVLPDLQITLTKPAGQLP